MRVIRRALLRRWTKEHFRGHWPLLALWVVLVFGVLFNFLMHSLLTPGVWNYVGNDFTAFYQASRNLWSGGDVYGNTPTSGRKDLPPSEREPFWGGYVYPTVFAAHLFWLLPFPLFWAKKVYVVVGMAVYVWIFIHLVRSLLRNSGPWALLAALFLWFQWGPSVDTFRLGQPNILVLLLLYLAWKCALGGRNHLPGALLGFATTIKLTPLVMFPILMIRKRWRTLIIACGTCLLVLLVCFPTLNWEYFTQLLPALKRATGDVDQPSIPFFLHRLFEGIQSTSASWSAPATKVIIMILCGVAYFIVLATARWRGREWSLPDLLLFGIGIVPLFSAKESHHYMVSVLPAFIVFASLVNSRSMLFRGSRKVLVGLGILLWLPMFYETTSLSFLWEGIGSVTGLWHRDQLMFAQALWFFVLWPRLHQRVGERPLAKESS